MFNYDNGRLFWKIRPGNRVNIGDEAGCVGRSGYHQIRYDRKTYKRHRLVYYIHTGRWPLLIDHIDQSRNNDKFENLRDVSYSVNSHNCNKVYGSTPFRGIYWNKGNKKYEARLCVNGIRYNLGSFTLAEEASKAYEKFKEQVVPSLVNL